MNGLRTSALKQSIVLLAVAALWLLGYARVSAAVTVSSFSAQAQGTVIQVTWTTATEIGNVGFHVLRSTASGGSYTTIDTGPGLITCRNCAFGSVTGGSYSFTDSSVSAGQTYYYKIQSVDSGGGTQLFGPKSASLSGPTATPTATATKTTVAATATPTATSVAASTSDSTSASPTATSPRATAASANATPTARAGDAPVQTPALTRVAIWVGPTAPSIPEAGGALPAATGVAVGIKESLPEQIVEPSSQTSAPADQSFNARNAIGLGVSLFAGILLIGSIGLGAASLYFFLCASLRR